MLERAKAEDPEASQSRWEVLYVPLAPVYHWARLQANDATDVGQEVFRVEFEEST